MSSYALSDREVALRPLPTRLGPRFAIQGELGSGAFGTVYVARDELLDRQVALKHLRRPDAAQLYRFKQEFRSLAGLYHPHLVRMHELFSFDGEWFFTMDLIEGSHFRAYVRGGDHDPQTVDTVVIGRGEARSEGRSEVRVEPEGESRRGVFRYDDERLRRALGQLALGVQALHAAGMLHRDLKPSNVLVTSEGERVKILDFGLVESLNAATAREERATISGTPAYMPPEQALAQPTGPPADWYAVGVMLYEALRGRLPFLGGLGEVSRRKRGWLPPDPRHFCSGLPDDLCELAMALLRYDSAERPTGAEVLACLGHRSEHALSAPAPVEVGRDERPLFVGREDALSGLRGAFAASRRGHAVLVEVVGVSGIGKSALATRFLDELSDEHGALVLRGRCHEQESVPYKALDRVVDGLAAHLRRAPASEQALHSRHGAALARSFPVLGGLPFSTVEDERAPNPQEQRRRAASALRELVRGLATRRPLVLYIDDTQWGDDDSIALLGEILGPPDPPALLLVGCSRPQTGDRPRRFLEEVALRTGAAAQLRRVEIGPLAAEEALRLAHQLLGPAGAAEDAQLAVDAAGGSPLFVAELARALRDGRGGDRAASLGEVLAARLDRLPADARLFLELVALAGQPIDEAIVRAAATRERPIDTDIVALLGAAQLLRAAGSAARPTVETPHDRIREEIVARLDPSTRARYHRHLADAIAESGREDHEALARHYAAAGELGLAAQHAELAGDRATAVLAFDRAATLYQVVLEVDPDPVGRVRRKLADALADAGRGVESAERYLEAADRAVERGLSDEALVRRRRAAEQLLRSGHIDRGIAVVGEVLGAVGLQMPSSAPSAMGQVVWNRLRLWLRGHRFVERSEAEIDAALLRELDVCWSVGNGLVGVDLLRSATFQSRHLALALAAGEPYRIARALAMEAITRALEGTAGQHAATAITAEAEELARRIAHPHATAWAASASAVTAWCEGRWRDCSQLSDYTSALFRERCADIFWELGSLEIWFNLPARYFLGDLADLARRAPASAKEAEARGDLYAATTVRSYMMPLVHLAADEPGAARAVTAEAIARWSTQGWHLQHWADLLSQTQVDLYEGDAARAEGRLLAAWPALQRSNQLRIQNVRMQARYWRARASLGRAAAAPADQALCRRALRRARKTTDRLLKEDHPMATALARSLEAAVAIVDGEARPEVRARLAAVAFLEAEMPMHAEAHELVATVLRRPTDERAAGEWVARLRARGLMHPARMTALLAHVPAGALDRVGPRLIDAR